MIESEPCAIHAAYDRYQDAAQKMRAFNPVYQKALAKNKVMPEMLERKSALGKEMRDAYKALRTELFLAGELPAEKWNDQHAVLEVADAHY
jgi:DNA-binding ferritin-like protein (Dps family)